MVIRKAIQWEKEAIVVVSASQYSQERDMPIDPCLSAIHPPVCPFVCPSVHISVCLDPLLFDSSGCTGILQHVIIVTEQHDREMTCFNDDSIHVVDQHRSDR